MADITITPRAKNNLTITLRNKNLSLTVDASAPITVDGSFPMTVDTQGLHLTLRTKNNLTITPRAKN